MRLIRFLIGLSFVVQPLQAAVLGDIQVRSALGERFNARINVIANENEELNQQCFRLVSIVDGGSAHLNARLSFESNEDGGLLSLRGDEPLQEPLLHFSIRLRCPSEKSPVFQRDYNVLLDPREYRAKQGGGDFALAAPAARRNLPAFSGVWQSQEGDSVERIARAYFPQDRASRARMVDEIYRLNADLAQNTHARLPLNTEVRLPDRKSLLPAAANMQNRVEPVQAQTSGGPDALQIAPVPLPRVEQGGFHLRLSEPVLAFRQKAQLSPEDSLRARERLQLLESDDQAAQLLQFKYQISQLEKQLTAMQAERSSQGLSLESAPALAGLNRLPSAWWLLLLLLLPLFYLVRRQGHIAKEVQYAFPLGQSTFAPSTAPLGERLREAVPDRQQVMGVVNNFSQAASDWSRDDVDVVQPKNVSEEAQMLLDHGLITQAINLLKSEIEQYPSGLALWMKLFEVYVSQGMRQEFQNRAVGFRLQFSSDGLWQQVQNMGRDLDPDNPLYLSLDENTTPLMFPDDAISFSPPDSKMEHVDFATGEILQVKADPWNLEPDPIEHAVQAERSELAQVENSFPEIPGLDLAHFLSDDPALQQVVQHLEQQDIHSACQALEQLLYRGSMEQRQTAIKWLDILIPLQM
ncbi:FimV family protein [Iodobacter arcticus]|uniref:FimV family protein n=1 Tax=Iodobacter arcticus TaxID=590593 RepID=A0ABW2QVI1_9NEIS